MVLKASWPDGHKQPGWAEIKEINKLKQEDFSLGSTKNLKNIDGKTRIKKQIDLLSRSAENQIRKKKPQEDVVIDKVGTKSHE
jgi:hypothetical protein